MGNIKYLVKMYINILLKIFLLKPVVFIAEKCCPQMAIKVCHKLADGFAKLEVVIKNNTPITIRGEDVQQIYIWKRENLTEEERVYYKYLSKESKPK